MIETEWITNIGASNHMKGTSGMLIDIHEYSRPNIVIIGDGSAIPIVGSRNSCIKQKNKNPPLYDVLLVPNLEGGNLLSINQLTSQFHVNYEFS